MNFEEIYIRHYKKLYSFAYQCTLSKQDSEDLVHETFTRLLKEIQAGTEIYNAQAWLYKVLINLINSSKNRSKHQLEIIRKNNSKELIYKDIQNDYILNEKNRIINEELKQMPATERNLLILYNRGLKYKEIAEILNINQTSIGTTLARVIIKFRNTLKTKYNELFE